MEVDPEKSKKFISYVYETFQKLETELLAHQVVLVATQALLTQYGFNENLQQSVEFARNSPAIQEQMMKKYKDPLEILLRAIDQASVDQAFEAFLKTWKPEGPPQ